MGENQCYGRRLSEEIKARETTVLAAVAIGVNIHSHTSNTKKASVANSFTAFKLRLPLHVVLL